MAHVSLHHVQPELIDHAPQLLHAFFIGRDLGFEIGQVLRRVATGVRARGQQGRHLGFAQHATVDQLEVLNLHALFIDGG